MLLILTAVDNVTLNFGTPAEEAISEMSIDDAKAYMEAGQFEFKSMLPKVKAAVDFVSAGKNRAAATRLTLKASAVMLSTSHGSATLCIQEPISERFIPIQ